jgi:hypothetical protein
MTDPCVVGCVVVVVCMLVRERRSKHGRAEEEGRG